MKHIYKTYHLVLITALTVILSGCSAIPYIPLRDENRANLVKLDPGMTKAQAIQTMGDTTATGRMALSVTRIREKSSRLQRAQPMMCCTITLGNLASKG